MFELRGGKKGKGKLPKAPKAAGGDLAVADGGDKGGAAGGARQPVAAAGAGAGADKVDVGRPNSKLFVEGLPAATTAAMLEMLFQQFPGACAVRGRESGHGLGMGRGRGGPPCMHLPPPPSRSQSHPAHRSPLILPRPLPPSPPLLPTTPHHTGCTEVTIIPAKPGIAFVDFETEMQASVAMTGLQGFKVTPQNAMRITYGK